MGLMLLLVVPGAAIALRGLFVGKLSAVAVGTGFSALPLVAFALANAFLLGASMDSRFCGSCHVMEPVVREALAGGDQLAARHIALGALPREQACYECHSNYGVWGTLQAKMAGVGHIVRNAFGWYEFPIKIEGTYPVSVCLHCHAQSEKFRAQSVHTDLDTQKAFLDGSLGCTGACHPSPHSDEVLAGPGKVSP
jgi:nitrate/TMAO reductase-like tetraheme cytochrome c subunit